MLRWMSILSLCVGVDGGRRAQVVVESHARTFMSFLFFSFKQDDKKRPAEEIEEASPEAKKEKKKKSKKKDE